MPATNLAILAAIFTMFVAATPAHAAYVETLDLNNVVFSGGDTVNGSVYINTNLPFSVIESQYLISVDGLYFSGRTQSTSNSVTGLYYNGGYTGSGPQSLIETLTVNLADLPNLSISDFTLTNFGQSQPATYAVSGSVSCVTGCSVSGVPLPNALPMFAVALLAIAGFAARRSKAKE